MKVAEIVMQAVEGRLSWVQAEKILGYSARHMRRVRQRYVVEGKEALRDKRAGRRMPKRVAQSEIERICELRREVYYDFNVKHFHEFLQRKHEVKASYTFVKNLLQLESMAERAPGRGKHRRMRTRRPMCGMMIHMDGSTHPWLGEEHGKRDLIWVLDDATGDVLYGQFVEQESTRSCLSALAHVIKTKGVFSELYIDRASHFGFTRKSGQAPEAAAVQLARVMKQLKVRMIYAWSPQARGRSERSFRTTQGRLPQELRAAGIRDWDEANAYLNEFFIADFNSKFTVEAAQPQTAFVTIPGLDVDRACALEHDVSVDNANCVKWSNRKWQIPKHPGHLHFVRHACVLVEYLDGRVDIEYGRETIAAFDAAGKAVTTQTVSFGEASGSALSPTKRAA